MFFIISYFCISFNSYGKCRNIISMHFKIGVEFMKRTYTQEEKQSVIGRFISREPSANILADTGITKSTFYGWLRACREKQDAARQKNVNIRNFHLLENKVVRLESIVEILKSATCTAKMLIIFAWLSTYSVVWSWGIKSERPTARNL